MRLVGMEARVPLAEARIRCKMPNFRLNLGRSARDNTHSTRERGGGASKCLFKDCVSFSGCNVFWPARSYSNLLFSLRASYRTSQDPTPRPRNDSGRPCIVPPTQRTPDLCYYMTRTSGLISKRSPYPRGRSFFPTKEIQYFPIARPPVPYTPAEAPKKQD